MSIVDVGRVFVVLSYRLFIEVFVLVKAFVELTTLTVSDSLQ